MQSYRLHHASETRIQLEGSRKQCLPRQTGRSFLKPTCAVASGVRGQKSENNQQVPNRQVPYDKQDVNTTVSEMKRRPLFSQSEEVVAMILGGGPGRNLWPLTKRRAEPAVPLGGYRLVDFPVSNCLNSNVNQIYVLTQFNSTSLNTHLSRAYQFLTGSIFSGPHQGFVEPLNATQTPRNKDGWYRGTADAVRRFSYLLNAHYHNDCQDVIVMMGDQLYRMNYANLLDFHRLNNADVTIASTPCDEEHATDLGVLQVDKNYKVQEFCEKPGKNVLATMSIDTTQFGLSEPDANKKPFMASMGVYVFKKSVLLDLLHQQFPQGDDFSRDILPYALHHLKIMAFPFLGYWEDVGTVKNYYNACMMLAKDDSKLRLWDREHPVYTEARMFPPSKMYNSEVVDSLVSDGCFLCGARVLGSLLGPCTRLSEGTHLQNVVTFGADTFETKAMREEVLARGDVPLGVGQKSVLKRCIVDKNARIGRECLLINRSNVKEGGRGNVFIKDGILIVHKDAVIPDGSII